MMDIQKIKELALANGFKLKEQASGNMDLNAYVYDFANAIEQAAKADAEQKITQAIVTLGEALNDSPSNYGNAIHEALDDLQANLV
ncbi:TPA: hypothetical protein ACSIVU_001005 [Acinetobacter baumannii]